MNSLYKHKSNLQLLSILHSSLDKKHNHNTDLKIKSIIRELKTRNLTQLQNLRYHKLVRKFSEY